MMKRSLFLRAACGLFVALAFAVPSEAASINVSEGFSVFNTTTPGATISSITFMYTGLNGISDIAFSGFSTPVVETPTFSSTAETVTLTFATPLTGVGGAVSFNTTSPYTDLADLQSTIKIAGITVMASADSISTGSLHFNVNSAVPEPTSMALLGIGMTSFLAFRRFFKRTAA